MNTKRRALLSAVALVVTTPIAVWSIAGVLTTTTSMVEGVAGALAALVAISTAVELRQMREEDRITSGWVRTPVLLCAAGALLAVGWRSLTTLGTGPTIAGGLFILPGLPVAVALLVAAGVHARREGRR